MVKQKPIKKKQKRQGERLLLEYETLESNEKIKSMSELRAKVKSVMRFHIGQENAIKPIAFFQSVIGIHPFSMNVYQRNYWWMVIKRILSEMRRTNELFIINKGSYLFVLQTQDEANMFKDRMDRNIAALKRNKSNADLWVKKRLWKKL